MGGGHVVGIDLEAFPDQQVLGVDLSAEPIPVLANTVQLVTAIDFLEHIPRWERTASGVRFPLVELFNEIFRVLEPGGFFFAETPVFPMSEVFQDPTHVNPMTTRTFSHYFAGPCWAQIYGFTGRFEVLEIGQNKGHLMTLMSADK